MVSMRAAAAAVVLVAGLAVPAPTSATPAMTFHGTFQAGFAYSASAGGGLVFGMPLGGVWNVNVNLSGSSPRAIAQFVVRYTPEDAALGFPAHGLHALWTPSFLHLQPLTVPSPAGAVIADAAGVVYDPSHGVYAFGADLPGTAVVAVVDTRAGTFFYAAVATPAACPPAADDPYCFDSVEVTGTVGR